VLQPLYALCTPLYVGLPLMITFLKVSTTSTKTVDSACIILDPRGNGDVETVLSAKTIVREAAGAEEQRT